MVWKCQCIQPASHYEYFSCLPHFAQIVLQWMDAHMSFYFHLPGIHLLSLAFCIHNLLCFPSVSYRSQSWKLLCDPTGLPWRLSSKAPACNAGGAGSIPESEDPLGEGKAPLSSILARRIPRTEETDGLQFIGLQRVKHDGSDSTHTCTHAIHSYFIILGRDYCVCSIVFAFSPQDDVPSLSTLLIF